MSIAAYHNSHSHSKKTRLSMPEASLMVGAIGVVFGDIGTSPLYTLRACLNVLGDSRPAHVLGILSLLFWLVMVVVSVKYVILILRADNQGEGGTLALLELALRHCSARKRLILTLLGMCGVALFYGDSVITPAISVLSAVEGINIVSHRLDMYVVPIALIVLVGLFAIQPHGTGMMGKLFGPIMLIWFGVLMVLGIHHIILTPQILEALNPLIGLAFIVESPKLGFLLLGAVVLALTGAEALYADMGHFGRPAIRWAWFGFVLPSLMLCYFGQGALLLRHPEALRNPFFLMTPQWALWPMVLLATVATIIASQAVISGAFSATRQAVQLGFLPRMEILYTSALQKGQIYLPKVNTLLLLAVLLLVVWFRSSEHLAAAYGFAVTGTMLTTSILAFAVLPNHSSNLVRTVWWVGLMLLFLVDLLLFLANGFKIPEGGWLPLSIGIGLYVIMRTWQRGRNLLIRAQKRNRQSLQEFIQELEKNPPLRVPGTAIFMTMNNDIVPAALLHNLKHNKVLHEQVVFLTISIADVPMVAARQRASLSKLSLSSICISLEYGFKEEINVPQALREVAQAHPEIDLEPMRTSYYLSRQTIVAAKKSTLWPWKHALFGFMIRNATRSTKFFKIPPNRVVEMGMQLEI